MEIFIKKCSCTICKTVVTTNNIIKHHKSKACYAALTPKSPQKIVIKYNNLNWEEIQLYYNQNHTTKECMDKFNIKRIRPFYNARRDGRFVFRTSSESIRLPEHRKRKSETAKKYYSNPDNRSKHSTAMKKAVEKYPDSYDRYNVCGRVKNIEYNGETLKGGWELLFAKYLDSKNIEWIKPNTPFEYQFEGRSHLYFPDFYLAYYDVYVEVKGYQRYKDDCKWLSVNNLIVIKEREIKLIKSGIFNIEEMVHQEGLEPPTEPLSLV